MRYPAEKSNDNDLLIRTKAERGKCEVYHDSPVLGLDFSDSGILIIDRHLESLEQSSFPAA